MSQCQSFPYLAASDACVLILGSLPGEESLRQQRYYAMKQNKFWPIMGALTGAAPDMDYDQRLQILKQSGVALWDVCGSAFRPGSLDSKIEMSSVVANDFAAFFKKHKKIELVCFNGQTAAKLYRQKVMPLLPPSIAALPHIVLPSTSPAHAGMRYEAKLALWRKAMGKKIRKL